MDVEVVQPVPAEAPAGALPDISGDAAIPSTQSLADFEAAFPTERTALAADPVEAPAQPRERHRAKSQRATPDDVKIINELTAQAKDAEAKAFSDIKQKDGESDRVFGLRRRKEIAERFSAGPTVAAPVVAPVAPVVAKAAPAPISKDDPKPDPTKYEDLTKYFEDISLWAGREAVRQDRAEQAKVTTAAEQAAETARLSAAWVTATTEAKAIYPDFEAVAYGPLNVPSMPHLKEIPMPSVIDLWIRERPYGARILYTLKKNPAEFLRIWNLSLPDQVDELSLLGQRLTNSSRTQTVSTAAVVPPVVKPVPRPPTAVQTGPMRVSDDALPDPESLSLSGFADAYGDVRRR